MLWCIAHQCNFLFAGVDLSYRRWLADLADIYILLAYIACLYRLPVSVESVAGIGGRDRWYRLPISVAGCQSIGCRLPVYRLLVAGLSVAGIAGIGSWLPVYRLPVYRLPVAGLSVAEITCPTCLPESLARIACPNRLPESLGCNQSYLD